MVSPEQSTLESIRVIALDVDGVLTDGSIILDNNGNETKAFHVRDGHALALATRAGLLVALITGRKSVVVDRRAAELGITEVHQGARDKVEVFREIQARHGFDAREAAYMGDDIVDVPLLKLVGLPAAPADADDSALACARFVSSKPGGRGAVRELIEAILRARGLWERLTEVS